MKAAKSPKSTSCIPTTEEAAKTSKSKNKQASRKKGLSLCLRACVCVCVCACVNGCVRVCVYLCVSACVCYLNVNQDHKKFSCLKEKMMHSGLNRTCSRQSFQLSHDLSLWNRAQIFRTGTRHSVCQCIFSEWSTTRQTLLIITSVVSLEISSSGFQG